MAEYIEREALKQRIRIMPRTTNPELVFISTVQTIISTAPTADVVEVRRGEWVKWGCMYKCTECDLCNPIDKPYCPNCGAKMDGKGEDNGLRKRDDI